MLTIKQARFCIEYCVDYNATQAAIRAGYSENGAQQQGSDLLLIPVVKERIAQRQEELAAAAELNPEWILRQWMRIASGDPSDLATARRINCRHCWGYGGAYQWTENEFRVATDRAIEKQMPAPDASGGFDYDPKGEPNPDCQECGGDGVDYVYVADTRKVKGNSRGLFAGVKQTKDGIEIKMRDQDAALKGLASYLGMTIDRKELSGPGGGAIAIGNLKASDFTDNQLAALIEGSDK